MEKKKILIIGFGVSGKAAAKAMLDIGYDIYIYDDNIKNIEDTLKFENHNKIKFLFNSLELVSQEFDLLMKSPGIKPSNSLIKDLVARGKTIISDIELGYKFKGKSKLIAITGTNGKTTTTALINYILNSLNIESDAVGNIGVGAVNELINSKKEALVIECSSFQLDNIEDFKADVSVITNISSDHLDYHESKENYIKAKLKLLKNLDDNNFAVLNYDDSNLKDLGGSYKKIYFSSKERLENGLYCDGNFIYYISGQKEEKLIDCSQLILKGSHNYENIMAALGVCLAMNLDLKLAIDAIYKFQGVKHRLQFVRRYKGVDYYNDSKGTNSDSTIKAIESFSNNIILILGGYDKNEDFTDLLKLAKSKTKYLIILGQTKEKINKLAEDLGYKNIKIVFTLEEAILYANKIAVENDTVLLSPACASWDMYKSFEERGEEFINLVINLE